MTNLRAEFEKWATINISCWIGEYRDETDDYKHDDETLAWQAYQAGYAAAVRGTHVKQSVDVSKIFRNRMIVCPNCGNKRCPKATNHANACTNSNEPGQAVSATPTPTKE